MTTVPGTRLGPYEIISRIGSGGMGEVFKASDTRLDRSVAIKILPAELADSAQFRMRFEREAKAISQLNHPHICTLHDVGENYIVMELLEGESLADRLARGPLPLRDVLRFGVQIADALERAHRAGIVHRDLKPGNIMLTKSGAKLLDFGLARTAPSVVSPDGATQHKALTEEGTIVGTFQYMAPEQIEGLAVDTRADIFAFGVVLYEMVTGRRAFEGRTRASLIAAILEHDPQPMSALQPLTPPALERLIRTCLDKDPDDRWQSAHDVKRELEWIQSSMSMPSEAAAVRRRSWRRVAGPLVLIALALALAAGAGWRLAARRGSVSEPRIVSAIIAPENTQFIVVGDAAGPLTLSPDGRHAVFVATSDQGSMLWLYSLATGTASPLPGTLKAMFPFWSPDSRSIGFFAYARLMVTDIDGSTPRVIADAPDARGGCWSRENQILFTPFTRAGIFRVPAAGGAAVAVTAPQAPYTTNRWPAFLEDGKHFVYIAAEHANPTAAETSIFVASVDGKDNRKLVESLSSAIPYRDRLLFVQAGKLVAQRITAGGLEGTPVVIWDNALTDPGTWRTVVSVSSNGLLATYKASTSSGSRLVWLDRTGKELGLAGADAVYRDIAVSPDGQKVAMSIGDPMGAIYVQDLAKGVRTRLSFVAGATADPVWTRDGRNVVFDVLSPGNRYEIYIKPADGSANERRILDSPQSLKLTATTSDDRLVFDSDGQSDILSMPLAGGPVTTIIGGPGQQNTGVVSPDGRWIVYVNADASGRAAFVSPYPQVGTKWQVSNDVVQQAWWSGNGKEILYFSADGQLKSVPVTVAGNSIELGAVTAMFRANLNTNRRSLSPAPDASRFLVIDPRVHDFGAAMLVTHFDSALD